MSTYNQEQGERQPTPHRQRLIPVQLVQDTNCLASVMAMAVNTLSRTGQTHPFTGHEVRQYLHSTRLPEIPRGLARLSELQNVYDVAVWQQYLLDSDPPLQELIPVEIDNGNLVQLFVSGNAWLQHVLQEDIQGRVDERHTVLVNGYTEKPDGLFLTIQDPMDGSLDVHFAALRKALLQYYPDNTFTIEDINDFKLYDLIYLWSKVYAT